MVTLNHCAPRVVDLSHHINGRSKARQPSPLKDILRFMAQEGMISLSGGLPHPSLFPIQQLSVTGSGPSGKPDDLIKLEISNESGVEPSLAKFLQYGNCKGNEDLRNWCFEFTKKVYRPAYKDFEILLHPGNTNAWSKVVQLFCEQGEYILTETFTYPSAQSLWIPEGYLAAPVAMDGQGIRPDALEETLLTWDETHPGQRRPHVLYLVSIGSNPSGVTMGAERRQKIYDLAVQYDFIIVEDDPYYFLQFPPYQIGGTPETPQLSHQEFVSSLHPSFLRYDVQGRVIRLDSFSKYLAPGLRLGFFVANSLFTERLLRATEVETQEPSGLSQAIVLSLFQKWTMTGYLDWLQNLRLEYQTRRDWIIDAFAQHFELVPSAQSGVPDADGIVASLPQKHGKASKPIFSFVPPTGGMFIWADFYLAQNSRFRELQANSAINDPEQTFQDELWAKLTDALVLVVPGSYYHPWQGEDKKSTQARGATPEICNFRFSYAMPSKEEIEEGIARFAQVVRQSWGGTAVKVAEGGKEVYRVSL